jgi:dTMP kinase
MTRGLFLSLDGLDGSGKSTQCRLLADWLRAFGRPVVTCVDPGGTDLGNQLRRILLTYRGQMSVASEALLFMASRAQLVEEVIHPALEDEKIVISDRFVLANVVYQGYAGGLNMELLWQASLLSNGGIEPDLTIVLDVPLDVALTRRKDQADRMESRGAEYFDKVRSGFLLEAQLHPDRIALIDASGPAEAVQDEIRQVVRRRLPGLGV